MRSISVFTAVALVASVALADTQNTTWTAESWVIKRDTVTLPGGPFATKALCQAAAPAAVNALGKSSNIFCQGSSGSRFTWAAPCSLAAPASSQTVACAAGLSPSWTQTRTVTATDAFSGCWATGAWAPATAPVTACQPPSQVYVNPYVPVDASATVALNQSYTVGTSVRNPTAGWSTDMLVPTTEVAPPSDIGAFRTGCQVVKHAQMDPLVAPGVYPFGHMHTFFGNMGIDQNSTSTTLASSGNSTCRGGTINRSAYWVPSLIDMRTHTPVTPMFESNFYYKTGYAVAPSAIVGIPVGLHVISGASNGTPASPSPVTPGFACWWSGGANGVGAGGTNWQATIPTSCTVNGVSWLIMAVDFPQCWDGNLDSPDHKSHVANPVAGPGGDTSNNHMVCPPDHPFALPQIAYQILYRYDQDPALLANVRLASDNYDTSQPAGYSLHADYMFAWKPDIVKVWTQKCDREQKDCHSHLLGDGRAMVIP